MSYTTNLSDVSEVRSTRQMEIRFCFVKIQQVQRLCGCKPRRPFYYTIGSFYAPKALRWQDEEKIQNTTAHPRRYTRIKVNPQSPNPPPFCCIFGGGAPCTLGTLLSWQASLTATWASAVLAATHDYCHCTDRRQRGSCFVPAELRRRAPPSVTDECRSTHLDGVPTMPTVASSDYGDERADEAVKAFSVSELQDAEVVGGVSATAAVDVARPSMCLPVHLGELSCQVGGRAAACCAGDDGSTALEVGFACCGEHHTVYWQNN